MKKNVGGLDRFFRIGVGMMSVAIFLATEDFLIRVVFGLAAIVLFATAAIGYCPINDRLGLNTSEKKHP